ncbi:MULTISPECIES: TonB-dependent receptor [unclassified Roseateles]|uniref:TonB-dependent receptor n=1 Tax=unclassified Roseateles TaxID=2626991 RepID=UPI0006FDA90C|nr:MULTISPECIES: TonB-dependent receptor [unclassified Roseateles]KQW45609.1 TonB-dependent receptor [Pelomonas sp. Root405]KRA72453.1 TonB-dependent receptor [Pelomonas sp. Root662]
MFKHNVINVAVLAALSATALSATAQQALERVEITGSSIKRVASEGALPVQTISAEQIRATGATNVADVIQRLPSMQGFQIADIAIGSNSGGIVTASIHDIGAAYTLVLLNGRRIAPTGSGSTINLNAIPMSAIERVEILTDGASALYGSDAIAGVVNFVLKRNKQGGEITLQADVPLEGGGESANASVTYGFGDIERDRFSVVATYRRDEQKQMKSGDREFAKSAYVPFSFAGRNYIYDRTSTSAIPANATVRFTTPAGTTALPTYGFNPYRKANGQCGPNNVYSLNNTATATAVNELCAFDFVSTIDIYPESTRDSVYLSGELKVAESAKLFADVAYSRYDLIARIAPNPVPVAISVASPLYSTYVLPYLTPQQASRVRDVTANYRASDFGTRDSQTITDSKHIVIGGDIDIGASWNVNGAVTWSQNAIDEKYVGGYMKDAEFRSMIATNAFDPFKKAGEQSAAAQQLIANAIFNGTVRTSSTTMKGADVRMSGDLFKFGSRTVSGGFGADFRTYNYKQTPSAAALAGQIYNYAAVAPYNMERDNAGVFGEVLFPVLKDLEVTAALRYDTIKPIKDLINKRDFGTEESATTYKLSGRYQATKALLLRGSIGTGFKAPSMLDIAQPVVPAGVTAASYDCPTALPGFDADLCKPGRAQYSVLSGGNEALKPEKSKQASLGVAFEPTSNMTMTLDYWQVNIRDAVSAVSANQAFANPVKYANLFAVYRTPAETQDFYAFKSSSTNIGRTINRGVDWDLTARFNVGIGRLTTGLTGTYMIRSSYTRPGTDSDFTDSMGRYGENAAVTFRNIFRATAKLETGAFSNTLTMNYRSHYKDITVNVRDVVTNVNVPVSVNVPEYFTFDWQGTYQWNKSLDLRAGLKNIFNKAPPFTLRDSSGHQVGYDPRYADPKLRTLQLTGTYKF